MQPFFVITDQDSRSVLQDQARQSTMFKAKTVCAQIPSQIAEQNLRCSMYETPTSGVLDFACGSACTLFEVCAFSAVY